MKKLYNSPSIELIECDDEIFMQTSGDGVLNTTAIQDEWFYFSNAEV